MQEDEPAAALHEASDVGVDPIQQPGKLHEPLPQRPGAQRIEAQHVEARVPRDQELQQARRDESVQPGERQCRNRAGPRGRRSPREIQQGTGPVRSDRVSRQGVQPTAETVVQRRGRVHRLESRHLGVREAVGPRVHAARTAQPAEVEVAGLGTADDPVLESVEAVTLFQHAPAQELRPGAVDPAGAVIEPHGALDELHLERHAREAQARHDGDGALVVLGIVRPGDGVQGETGRPGHGPQPTGKVGTAHEVETGRHKGVPYSTRRSRARLGQGRRERSDLQRQRPVSDSRRRVHGIDQRRRDRRHARLSHARRQRIRSHQFDRDLRAL